MPPTRFAMIQIKSPNPQRTLTCFVVFETDSPNFYRHPTCFAVVETDTCGDLKRTLLIFKGLIHAIAMVKTDPPNLYRPPTRPFVV